MWTCLSCARFGCGRYENGHAKTHFEDTKHPLALDINSKLCFWYPLFKRQLTSISYECDAYVAKDNKRGDLSTIRRRLEALETLTVPESRTRSGAVLKSSQLILPPLKE